MKYDVIVIGGGAAGLYCAIEAGKRGGQPCIRGMRITVYDVLSYLAAGMTEEEVLSDFPELTHEEGGRRTVRARHRT